MGTCGRMLARTSVRQRLAPRRRSHALAWWRFALVAPIALLALALLGACGGPTAADSATPPTDSTPEAVPEPGGLLAGTEVPPFELTGPWINGDPVLLEQVAAGDGVLLVEFWNRSCADCLQQLEVLDALHRRYEAQGLVVIGIHSPDFGFEEAPEMLRETVHEQDIRFPVVQDGDRSAWLAFENDARPARYVVDADGVVRFRQVGGGPAEEVETAVREALEAAGADLTSIPPPLTPVVSDPADAPVVSRDLYFGYQHNYHPAGVYAAQPEYYEAPEEPLTFVDPGAPREFGVWYAHGDWSVQTDALVQARQDGASPSYVVFRFEASSVALVAASAIGEPVTLIVQLDGFPLRAGQAGSDVEWDELGRSVVVVDEPRIYDIATLEAVGDHQMRFSTFDAGLALYVTSFDAPDERDNSDAGAAGAR